MSKLLEGLNQTATTQNGDTTNYSTLDSVLDLFAKVGSMRGHDITGMMSKAFNTDKELTTRTMLWARDVRGGAGERQLFRDYLKYLEKADKEELKMVLPLVPEVGRWDDLLIFDDAGVNDIAYGIIMAALKEGNQLCAKWMPRNGKKASKLRTYLGKKTKRFVTPKAWRKALVDMSDTVEQKMSAKDYEGIDFSKIPSLAAARYQKAFMRNVPEKYQEYVDSLEKGEAKINAQGVYPYDVIKSLHKGNKSVASQQWKALPDYLEGKNESVLPVIDVSGSMGCGTAINGVTAMDIAIGLGLYLSERISGPFKDHFITFSERPKLNYVTGDLQSRVTQIENSNWGYNTNVDEVFSQIVNVAERDGLTDEDMPDTVIILSDMQFDLGCRRGTTMNQRTKARFKDAGLKVPNLVYWDVSAHVGTFPVTVRDNGTCIVSGFSPSIMSSVLGNGEMNPTSIMMDAIMKDRYDYRNFS